MKDAIIGMAIAIFFIFGIPLFFQWRYDRAQRKRIREGRGKE